MSALTCQLRLVDASSMRKFALVAPTVVISATLLILAACHAGSSPRPGSPSATQTPTPSPVPRTPVRFAATDGVRIAGSLFGSGRLGVVLGHGSDGSQQDWWVFAQTLARDHFAALAIDFRGYCPGGAAGCSQDGSTADAWKDMLGGARYLEAQGARKVVLMGSSMGATASIVAAAHPFTGVAGVVSLSGSSLCCGMVANQAVIERIHVPMLLVVGRLDEGFVSSTRTWGRWAGSAADTAILGSGEHGVDLLRFAPPNIRERVSDLILGFLREVH
jgi:dienelactone hydrolase